MGTCIITYSPQITKGKLMPRSARPKEWGPETQVEWMLKSKGVPKQKIKSLLESREQIRQAWDWDNKGTKNFPVNTGQALYEIEGFLKGQRRSRRKPKKIGLVLKQ